MTKLAFKLYTFIAILSPWGFLGARLFGVYNYKNDVVIFGALFLLSTLVMFLTYKTWEK